ncbi:DoxX family protein [Brucella pseudogrignonensis]|nr:DoxX family protein [Brucella pseudogrignonensis]
MTIRSVFTTGLAFLLSPQNAASYARWAYPDWFHYITATLELAAAALLINPATRKLGAAIGSFVMAAASLTTLFHAEYDQAIAPLIVLTVSLLTFILSQGVHPEN